MTEMKNGGEFMRFTDPEWLYLLVVPVLLIPFGAYIAYRKRKRILSVLLGNGAKATMAVRCSPVSRFWRIVLLLAAICVLIVAAAGPYFYSRLLPFEPKGRDLLVVCDVSKSMNSNDIAPSRLKHAKFLLRQLAEKRKGDRFGLAAFAGNAYLACPLTSDPVTFLEYVDEISTGSVPVGGTNLERALQVAEKAFAGSESNNRAIILLTDGEEVQGNTARAVAGLRKMKIPVFAVGFGDPVNGSVIPVEEGKSALVRDEAGKVVTSRLNEKVLTDIARETGGVYVRTTVTDPGTAQLEAAIGNLGRSGSEKIKKELPADEFPKFIGAAVILVVIFLLLSERGGAKKASVLLLMCALTMGAAEKEEGKKEKEAPAMTVPEDPGEMYNLARKLQLEKNPAYRELYERLLKKVSIDSDEARMSFHNLGAGSHEGCRADFAKAQKEVAAQQLDEALKSLEKASEMSNSAEELYSRSVAGRGRLPEPLSANLTRLARDRKAIEELKKKIEELKKQQQKAQNQTRQAQNQNRSKPQNQKQRQEQQSSIDKAQQEAEKLRDQAQNMQQEKLANAAGKSAKELKKASEAKKNKEDAKAQKHLENAMKELAGQEKKPREGKDKNADKKADGKKEPQKPRNTPNPGEKNEKKPDSKMSAEQLLDLMGEEDKKLRSEIQKRQNMRRPKVEKDW